MLTERQKKNARIVLRDGLNGLPGFKGWEMTYPRNGESGRIELNIEGVCGLYWVRRVGNKWLLLSHAGYRACECGYFDTFTGAVKKIVSYAKRDCVTS